MANTIAKGKKLQTIVLEEKLLSKLNDLRFDRRFESVSAAIRSLIASGLVREGYLEVAPGVPPEPPSAGPWEAIIDKDGRVAGWKVGANYRVTREASPIYKNSAPGTSKRPLTEEEARTLLAEPVDGKRG